MRSRAPWAPIICGRVKSTSAPQGADDVFVLIVGAGRVGSAVAKRALAAGYEVSVVDEDPLSHERLEEGGGPTWEDLGGHFTVGTALEVDALIEAGVATRRRLHRLDRRGQHEPHGRSDRAAPLRRRKGHLPGHGPRARRLVPGAGTAHDLPDPARRSRCSSRRLAGIGRADVRDHRRRGQGGVEPRARAARQGPRGDLGSRPTAAATSSSSRSSATSPNTAMRPSCGSSSAPACSARTS